MTIHESRGCRQDCNRKGVETYRYPNVSIHSLFISLIYSFMNLQNIFEALLCIPVTALGTRDTKMSKILSFTIEWKK
jgi:hypothetical protein